MSTGSVLLKTVMVTLAVVLALHGSVAINRRRKGCTAARSSARGVPESMPAALRDKPERRGKPPTREKVSSWPESSTNESERSTATILPSAAGKLAFLVLVTRGGRLMMTVRGKGTLNASPQ
jgi:hypothetical protein